MHVPRCLEGLAQLAPKLLEESHKYGMWLQPNSVLMGPVNMGCKMRVRNYLFAAGIGATALLVGLFALFVGATVFGSSLLGVGGLIALSVAVGAVWNS